MVIWLADRFPGYFRDLHKFQAVPFNCAVAGAGCALLVVLAVVFCNRRLLGGYCGRGDPGDCRRARPVVQREQRRAVSRGIHQKAADSRLFVQRRLFVLEDGARRPQGARFAPACGAFSVFP